MFPTRADEQKYLGLIHPGSGIMHVYDTLPMGTRNLSGTSGRFGAAFLLQIRESYPLFQGIPQDNSFHSSFQNSPGHPNYGTGRVVVLLWMHMDDILIHAPTQKNLATSLDYILDMTLILVLSADQKKRCLPPNASSFVASYMTPVPPLHSPSLKVKLVEQWQ